MAKPEQAGTWAGVFLVHDRAAVRVSGLTSRKKLPAAKEARAARNRERHDDTVPLLDPSNCAAGVLHDSHEFVPEDVAAFHPRELPPIDVHVGATNGGGGYAQQNVIVVLENGVRYIVNAYVVRSVVSQCFHGPIRSKTIVRDMVHILGGHAGWDV